MNVEDIGDIFYFIMIVVFALAGMIGKKAKKQEKQGQPVPAPPKKEEKEEEILIPSWEEFEKQLQRKREVVRPAPETVLQPVSKSRSHESPQRKTYRTEIHRDSAETLYSPEYEQPAYEPLSYDTTDDVSKLRIKKQMKENIFKKQSSFKTIALDELSDPYPPLAIAFDDVEEVKKAFIYSEIFHRKYQ